MDVDHNMVFGIFGDSIMEPCGPLLVANVHESELDAADAPFLIQGQQFVQLAVEGSLVDIDPYAYALRFGILAHFRHGEVSCFDDITGIAPNLALGTVPACIQFYIIETELSTIVYALEDTGSGQFAERKALPGFTQFQSPGARSSLRLSISSLWLIRSTARSAAMMTRQGVS